MYGVRYVEIQEKRSYNVNNIVFIKPKGSNM